MAQEVTVRVDGTDLSGLFCESQVTPSRGTILALHGGGYTARYWDGPVEPRSSLLSLAAELGYSALALNRPGYGASSGFPREKQDVAHQSGLLTELVESLPAQLAAPHPVVLVGHSLGAIVSLQMAADAAHRAATPIVGVAVSGLPVEFAPSMIEAMAQISTEQPHLPSISAEYLRAAFYGPDGTWAPETLSWDAAEQAPIPVTEFFDAFGYPSTFPAVAAAIRVPVQYVVAEYEASNVGGPDVLARGMASFTSAARVDSFLQSGSGHNISLHRVAAAYHLRVLAFAEECLALGPSAAV